MKITKVQVTYHKRDNNVFISLADSSNQHWNCSNLTNVALIRQEQACADSIVELLNHDGSEPQEDKVINEKIERCVGVSFGNHVETRVNIC